MSAALTRSASRLTVLILTLGTLFPQATAHAISSRPLITGSGLGATDFAGYAVASAGDVNGDGHVDVIVGAPGSDFSLADGGRAYVYFGGPTMDAVPDWTLTGAGAGDQFGVSVDGAGDMNGDGFDDVIVGANQNDAGGANAGRAYVYLGGVSPNTAADMVLTGVAAGDGLGNRVAGLGDVNGDGFDDVIVGAPYNDAGGAETGRAYVHYGAATLNSIVDLTLTGLAAGDVFAFTVGAAGDVNSDGYADMIAGAYDADINGATSGSAYVYLGGPAPDATPDWTVSGPSGDALGIAVSSAGDFNGDGYGDILVGASGSDVGGAGAGQAHVYYGGGLADDDPDVTFTGVGDGDQFGFNVAPAGDVNADGFDDVLVGAPTCNGVGFRTGAVYLFFGGSSPNAVADVSFVGSGVNDQMASSGGLGDINGDGYGDLIVGETFNDIAGTDVGRFFVMLMYPYEVLSPNGGEQWVAGQPATVRWRGSDPADIALSLDGGATYSTLANGVGGAEDNTFVVTAPYFASPAAKVRVSQRGAVVTRSVSDASDAVFRIVAPTDPPPIASRLAFAPIGFASQDNLGTSVDGAGDVNGDGYDDVIAGAPGNDLGGAAAGQAYVYFGGPGADAVADWTLTGAAVADQFGIAVGGAGDVNRDGFADVIVGASFNDAGGADAGRAYVFFGGLAPDAVADLTLTGAVAGDRFGAAVGAAGDVNGDGHDDVIVGAPLNDTAGLDAGRVYVFFGGLLADGIADWILTGVAAGDQFGASVSGAGEVNGDPYDDVIVGAPFNDAAGTNAGRAYVYQGGQIPDATVDLTLDGRAAQDNFGFSVSGAGDVNGDGHADVIVGAPLNDTGASAVGQAYVFFGGPGMDAVSDWTLTGGALTIQLGYAVGSAGDVNGDGFADVVAGAPFSDIGALNGGSAYVYFGGTLPDDVADRAIHGTFTSENLGTALGTADVMGDGFSDVIASAYLHDGFGSNIGRVCVHEFNRYFVLTPNDDEVWNVGAGQGISWLGAERADVWLSVNGGVTYEQLRHDVGGEDQNTLSLLVPHTPTRFARIKLTPANPTVGGADESDSTFTIQSSVALLLLVTEPTEAGTEVRWSTEPAVGPAGLAGYRLYRIAPGASGNGTRIGPDLIAETRYVDTAGGAGHSYRLTGVNGLREELELGRVTVAALSPLAASPLPYRGGPLTVSFGVHGRFGASEGEAEVRLFDLGGRRVRTLARGTFRAGHQVVIWDGLDDRGGRVENGLYFLQVASGGERHSLKLVVSR